MELVLGQILELVEWRIPPVTDNILFVAHFGGSLKDFSHSRFGQKLKPPQAHHDRSKAAMEEIQP